MNELKLTEQTHIHLIGVAGTGISAIARVLLARGVRVSGSDMQDGPTVAALRAEGATVFVGHVAGQEQGATAVVRSSAIPDSNPEVVGAREAGIPVLKRADFLGALMAGQQGIAVAGSHGKTTTTGMIAQIFLQAGLDPSVVVGSDLPVLAGDDGMPRNGRYGHGGQFIIEADEYDYMFMGVRAETAVVTAIEHDHPDMFPTAESYETAFTDFVGLLPSTGQLVVCIEDEGVSAWLPKLADDVTVITYGLSKGMVRAVDLRPNRLGGTDFLLTWDGQTETIVRLRLPGKHNVLNALAAIVVARQYEISYANITVGLADFGGAARRFEIMGRVGNLTVIDDYAHHPTAIRTTLQAVGQRFPGRQIWAVWQPHTYSRTKLLQAEFAASFTDADRVVVLPIYASRERETLGMTAQKMVDLMSGDAVAVSSHDEATAYLLERVRPNDVVILLGAGDGNKVGKLLLERLEQRVWE